MQTPQFRLNFVSLSFFLRVLSFLSCLLSLLSTPENSASRLHHFRWDSIECVNAVCYLHSAVWSQSIYVHVWRAFVCSHAPLSLAGWVRAIDWTQCHFPYTLCATNCFSSYKFVFEENALPVDIRLSDPMCSSARGHPWINLTCYLPV